MDTTHSVTMGLHDGIDRWVLVTNYVEARMVHCLLCLGDLPPKPIPCLPNSKD